MTDVSMAVSGGSFPGTCPASSYTDYILDTLWKVFDVYAVFKTVYLIILNEEKGGTCEANWSLRAVLR